MIDFLRLTDTTPRLMFTLFLFAIFNLQIFPFYVFFIALSWFSNIFNKLFFTCTKLNKDSFELAAMTLSLHHLHNLDFQIE